MLVIQKHFRERLVEIDSSYGIRRLLEYLDAALV